MPFPLFKKDPDEVLDYGFDWETWLDGDTISESTWSVPSGLTKDSDSKTTTTTLIWLSGGTLGQTYSPIVNAIVTAGGRTANRSFTVKIEEK